MVLRSVSGLPGRLWPESGRQAIQQRSRECVFVLNLPGDVSDAARALLDVQHAFGELAGGPARLGSVMDAALERSARGTVYMDVLQVS